MNEVNRDSPLERTSLELEADRTLELLERARAGDRDALDELVARYLPRLQRWARGRLPQWARDLADTDDLVQDTLLRTLKGLDDFESRGEGALQAYLRQSILNRIRDQVRRAGRRGAPLERHGLSSVRSDQHPAPVLTSAARRIDDH